ncbi:hypothetical protein F4679DRAFT_583357 [Xylaria curta]|nr:hypothetical protein F4679DRAFT_583357 [Xylaria curta]
MSALQDIRCATPPLAKWALPPSRHPSRSIISSHRLIEPRVRQSALAIEAAIMVVLQSLSHHEHRIKKVDRRSSERQKSKPQPTQNRRSPRRTRNEPDKEAKRDQIPTPLMEMKNGENSRAIDKQIAIRSKINTDTSQHSEANTINHNANQSNRSDISKEKARKAQTTKGVDRCRDVNRNWGKRSTRNKRSLLEDEIPLIIQCWQ